MSEINQKTLVSVGILLFCSLINRVQCLDELLSARCQAKCLDNFESNAKDNGISRRQLKHTIIPLCKNDLNCSSCAAPCREHYESSSNCFQLYCTDVKSLKDCRKSCTFLKEIYESKPGICPKPKLGSEAEECVTSCRRDGDCPHTEKCCWNGCGRSCASIEHNNMNALLPIPIRVSIKERKRGRSAVVRWVMPELKPDHTKTYANLYVIQWRWGVKPDDAHMTRWQTITVRNKLYAILKHLLSPGRYYRFRVAAVNIHGSKGFSASSDAFRLSKSPKAPGKPRNLSKGLTTLEKDGSVTQEIHWLPPTSDLPIVHYQVTWSVSDETTDSAIQSDMPSLSNGENSIVFDKETPVVDEMELLGGFKTEIVSAELNSITLKNLRPVARYLIEVHAIVETEKEELQGEKTAFYLTVASVEELRSSTTSRTLLAFELPSDQNASPTTSEKVINSKFMAKFPKVVNLRVEKPYFHNGLLKVSMLWDLKVGADMDDSDVRFEISWWPTVCLGASYPEFSLTKPIVALSQVRTFELYDLQFGCHYGANVTIIVSGIRAVSGTKISFETPACQDTPVKGDVVPTCPTMPPDVPATPQHLSCDVSVRPVVSRPNIKAGHNVTATCSWSQPFRSDRPIIGYRVISGQKLTHNLGISGVEPFPSIDRNTVTIRVLKKNVNILHLHSLIADTEYIVQVQAISEIGVGPAVYETFFTPSLRTKLTRKGQRLLPGKRNGIVYRTENNPDFIQELHLDETMSSDQRSGSVSPQNGTSTLLTINTYSLLLVLSVLSFLSRFLSNR